MSARTAITAALLGGVLVGIAAILWSVPASGVDTQPPQCYATLGNTVACDSEAIALAAAAVVALFAGALTYLVARRLPSQRLRMKVTLE